MLSRKIKFVGGFSSAHFLLSYLLGYFRFSLTNARFDLIEPTLIQKLIGGIIAPVLHFPLNPWNTFIGDLLPRPVTIGLPLYSVLVWALLILNSLLWGFLLLWLFDKYLSRRKLADS